MKLVVVFFSFVFILGIYTSGAQCCSKAALADNQVEATIQVQEDKELKVEAYYFHMARRCVTCRNVERVSSESLQELYGKKIQLKSINLEEKAGKELAKKLGVEGQSLLFVNGNKKVDLTVDGFMLAQTAPEKFKEKIRTTVESLK
jgi:hypothetical protein